MTEAEELAVDLQVLTEAANATVMSVDTETNAGDCRDGRGFARGVSVAFVIDGVGYKRYFPFRHVAGRACLPAVLAQLKQVLEACPALIFHNAKFDIVSLKTLGIDVYGHWFFDTMIGAQLVNENWPMAKTLDQVALTYLGEHAKDITKEFEKEKNNGFPTLPSEEVTAYAEADAAFTWRLGAELLPATYREAGAAYWQHKQRLVNVLINMEGHGIRIDTVLARSMAESGDATLSALRTDMGINPGSRNDLQRVLLDELGLPVVKASIKTGAPSFDKEAMAEYDAMLDELDSPIATQLREYRGWQKAVSSYYRPYLEKLSPDGRLRCNYRLDTTVTGRFSCTEPNLQQIPKVTDKPWNGRAKECFIPSDGYTLIEVDYSQLELRLTAAYSREQKLIDIFNDPDRDVFDEMAADLGMTRDRTKTLNYSIQYGAGVNRIMNAFRVDRDAAKQIIDTYWETYPAMRGFSGAVKRRAERDLRIDFWSGRWRHFRNKGEGYKAMNSLIQGGGADIMEYTMVRLFDEVQDDVECRMLLQVHDAIVFEIKNEYVDHYTREAVRVMSDVKGTTGQDFGVKFAVDAHVFGGHGNG